jgi:hypothetical protein
MLFIYLQWFCRFKINGLTNVFILLKGSFLSSIICTMNLLKSWLIMLVQVIFLLFSFLHGYFLLRVMT